MKDFLRDDLKYKEIPPNHRKKIPTITIVGILHTFMGMVISIWPTYPENLCPNFFFRKSMAQKYPTYLQFGHMSKISYFFFFESVPNWLCCISPQSDKIGVSENLMWKTLYSSDSHHCTGRIICWWSTKLW